MEQTTSEINSQFRCQFDHFPIPFLILHLQHRHLLAMTQRNRRAPTSLVSAADRLGEQVL